MPIMAFAAAAMAATALAQQGAENTVPQARFETTPGAGQVLPQPRFARAPGTGTIEVSPLAPPGAAEGMAGVAVIDRSASTEPPGIEPSGDRPRFKAAPRGPAIVSPGSEAVPIDTPPTELRQGVRLRELDKMTGQTETFELAVGEERQVDRLKIRLEACRSPEGNDTHGTIAFLKVWDVREPEGEAFSGWMFAESPSLSALDHPRYDLWVISCTTSAVAVSSPSE